MDDRDVLLIEQYIHENFPPHTIDQYDSYSRWAAEEILSRVIDEAMKLPAHLTGVEHLTAAEIVENFIEEMDYYSYMSRYDVGISIFSVAREEGKMCLDYIRSYE